MPSNSSSIVWRQISRMVASSDGRWRAENRWLVSQPLKWVFVGFAHEPWRISDRLRIKTMFLPLVPSREPHYDYSFGLELGSFDRAKPDLHQIAADVAKRLDLFFERTLPELSADRFVKTISEQPAIERRVESTVDAAFLAASSGDLKAAAELLNLVERPFLSSKDLSMVEALWNATETSNEALCELLIQHRQATLSNLHIKASAMPEAVVRTELLRNLDGLSKF